MYIYINIRQPDGQEFGKRRRASPHYVNLARVGLGEPYTCMYVYMYMYIHVRIYIYMDICGNLTVKGLANDGAPHLTMSILRGSAQVNHIDLCTYICICIYMYVYIYIYTYVATRRSRGWQTTARRASPCQSCGAPLR